MAEQQDVTALLETIKNQPPPAIHFREMPLSGGQEKDETEMLREQVRTLTAENESLKGVLDEKERQIAVQEATVQQLKKQARESEEELRVRQNKLQGEQAKIDKLTTHLEKVEKLLQKLLGRKGNTHVHRDHRESGEYVTPHKGKMKLDLGKLDGNFAYSDSFGVGSYRSSNDSISSLKKSPALGSNTSYARMQASPSSYGSYETEEYRRYRREKLLASQTVEDVLKIDKLKRI